MYDVDKLWARSDSFRLLSLFMGLPTEEIARGVVDGSLVESVSALLDAGGFPPQRAEAVIGCCLPAKSQELGMSCDKGMACGEALDEVLSELRRDYTALFTNPEHAHVQVYEACFKQSDDFDTSQLAFVSPTALDAEREYRDAGFMRQALRNESPDHMGTQTEFLGILYANLAETASEGEPSEQVLASIERFDQKHFLKWGEAFFEQVASCAQSEAYRLIGRLGMLMAQSEREFAQERGGRR